jgi:hypothetical protein
MPVAGQVVDFYDDADYGCLKKVAHATRYGDMHVLTPEEHASLSDDSFGLIVLTKNANVVRKFPIHDEGHIYLSAQYFDQNHTKLSAVEKVTAATHIREACDAYDIEAPASVAKYAEDGSFSNVVSEGSEPKWFRHVKESAAEELSKTASVEINARLSLPDEQYALVLTGDGETIRKYAMPDKDHVKIASAYFKKYAMDLAPTHRHMFAKNVMRRAVELDTDVGDFSHLVKWASPKYNENVDAYLEQRKSLIPRDEAAQAVLDKLASQRDTADPITFAEALHMFDKQAGIDKYYDRGVTDPWASTLGIEKKANWSTEVDGDTVTSDDLMRVASSDKFRSHFGETFQGQFKKHAVSVFESLPTPEKVIIKQMARGEI